MNLIKEIKNKNNPNTHLNHLKHYSSPSNKQSKQKISTKNKTFFKLLTKQNILIITLLLFSLLPLPTNHIYQEKQFKNLSKNTFIDSNSSFNFCFSKLKNNFRYIAIEETREETLDQVIKNQAYFYEYEDNSNDSAKTLLTGEYNEPRKIMFFYSEIFQKIEFDLTYCIQLISLVQNSNRLQNLNIYFTSSMNLNSIVLDREYFFGRVDQYNLSSDPALMCDSNFTLTPEAQDIYENTNVKTELFFNVILPDGKSIPTTADQIIIVLIFKNYDKELVDGEESDVYIQSNINIEDCSVSSIIDTTNENEKKLTNLKFQVDSDNTNTLVIHSIEEDLINGRKIPLTIDNIKIQGSVNITLTTRLLWKNTNSIISNHTIELFSSNKRIITSASIKNPNNISTLYTNSNWPLIITLSLPVKLDKATLVIENASNNVYFIPSTCDFSLMNLTTTSNIGNSSTMYCKNTETLGGNNKMEVLNLSSRENFEINIKFWVHAYKKGIPTINVYIKDITDTKAVNNDTNINIFDAYSNKKKNFDYTQCMVNTDSNCENRLIVNENSGNFVLLENNNIGVLDLSDQAIPMKLEDLKPTNSNNYFRIRFKYDFTEGADSKDLGTLANAWAGDWTKFSSFTEVDDQMRLRNLKESGNLRSFDGESKDGRKEYDNNIDYDYNDVYNNDIGYDEHNLDSDFEAKRKRELAIVREYTLTGNNNIVLGKNIFYFPQQFIVPVNAFECKMVWGSDVSLKTNENEHPNFQSIVKFISEEALYNNFKKFFLNSSSISENKISFDNFDFSGVLKSSLFHNLVMAISCTTPDEAGVSSLCSSDNNPDDLTGLTFGNFEISTSCARYKSDFEFKSYYTEYDFFHTFSVKNTNTIIRANRFISLLPQPGIFELLTTTLNPGRSDLLLYNTYIVNTGIAESPCLVELDFTNLNSFYSTKTNNRFFLFLLGIELIDFDDGINYPISQNLGAIGYSTKHIYTGAPLKNPFSKLTNQNSYKLGNTDYFSNSFYRNYLTSLIYFTNIVLTNLPTDILMIPIKCTNYDYSMSSTDLDPITNYSFLMTEINETSTKTYSSIYFYDNNRPVMDITYDFKVKPLNPFTENATIVSSTGKFNAFVVLNSTKLSFQTETLELNTINDTSKFVILLHNNLVNSNNLGLLSNNGFIINETFYRTFLIDKKCRLNNVMFNYMTIFSTFTNDASLSGIVDFDSAGVQFEGLSASNSPSLKNDYGIFIGGNENAAISNYSVPDLYYLVGNPEKIIENNPLEITLKVDFVDNTVIKDGPGKNAACVKVDLKLIDNITKFLIYSPNFIPQTIAGESNRTDSIQCTYNPSSYFDCKNFSGQSLLFFCNVDLSTNKFEITKLLTYFEDSAIEYKEYTFTPSIETDYAIPSLEYTGASIDTYEYSTNYKTYGELTLRITSDYSPFRNMRMMISGDLGDLRIDSKLMPYCRVYFIEDQEDNYETTFFSSCSIDFSGNLIVVTSLNDIFIYEPISKKFYIKLFPVMITNLGDISINIESTFNTETLSDLFPIKTKIPSSIEIDQSEIVNISQYIEITNIYPYIPGDRGVIVININLNTSEEVDEYFNKNENTDKKLNELIVIFNTKFYGNVPFQDDLVCYINNILVNSCYNIDNKLIKITYSFQITQGLMLNIYGFKIPDLSIVDVSEAIFLIQFNYVVNNTPQTILHGIGKIFGDIDKNEYNIGEVGLSNLVFYHQEILSPFPNNTSDLIFYISMDSISGLNSSAPVSDMKDSYLWIHLPNEITASSFSELLVTEFSPEDENPNNFIDYSFDSVTFQSHFIFTKIAESYKIKDNFKYWIITIKNVRLTSKEVISDLIEITFFKRSSFLLKTFPMLYSQYNKSSLKNPFGYFTNQRGITIAYNDSKYYFETTDTVESKPGVFKELPVQVKHKKAEISNASTLIYLDSNFSFDYETDIEEYLFDARFNSKKSIFVGLRCEVLTGKYIVRFINENTENFFEFPTITITINSKEKEVVRFYTDIGVPYSSSSSANIMSKGGIFIFWVKPLYPNFNEFTIGFEPDPKTDTSIPFTKNTIVIPRNSKTELVGYYEHTIQNIDEKQTYLINVYDNCYKPEVETISFLPTLLLESFIQDSFNFSSIITYDNAISDNQEAIITTGNQSTSTTTSSLGSFQTPNSGSSNQNSSTNKITYPLNSIAITFTPTKLITFPLNSLLYCSLFCENLEEPENSIMTTLPLPENTWGKNYIFKKIPENEPVTIVFNNLMREVNYKLKCILETGNFLKNNRNNYTETFSVINQVKLTPLDLNRYTCVSFNLQNIDPDFELNALKIIQDEFYFNDYLNNGCVTGISQNGLFIDGYNPIKVECSSLIKKEVLSEEKNNNSDEDDFMFDDYNEEIKPANNGNNTDAGTSNVNVNDVNGDTNSNTNSNTNNNNNNNDGFNNQAFTNTENRENNRRFLQLMTTNEMENQGGTTNGNTNSNSNSNSNTPVILNGNIIICLTQAQNCPSNIESKEYDQILTDLLMPNLQNSNQLSDEGDANTKFLQKLPEEMRASILNFSYRVVEENIAFPNIEIINNSDFKTSNTTALIKINFGLSSQLNKELLCFWSLNKKPLLNSNMTTLDILNCKENSEDILCGDLKGVVIPVEITEEVEINLFSRSEIYSVWITCKENLILAEKFSIPQATLFTPNFPVIIKNETNTTDIKNQTIVDCIKGNPDFPICCPSGMIDIEDDTKCAIIIGSFIKFSGVLLLLLSLLLF